MRIQAIETSYAGCRFRSRLEARWAVFFDNCDPPLLWEYEPQGYQVPTVRGRIRYLPDFWLRVGQWAEVKGYLDDMAMTRQWALAQAICQCGNEQDIVMLGDVPGVTSSLWPVQLHAHGEHLWGVPWSPEPGCPLGRPRIEIRDDRVAADMLTKGAPFGAPDWAEDGLAHARRARFEWGESGGLKSHLSPARS